MLFKLLFIVSIFIGLFDDLMVQKYLSNVDIIVNLLVVNIASAIILIISYFILDIKLIVKYIRKKSCSILFGKLTRFVILNLLIYNCQIKSIPSLYFMILVNIIGVFWELLHIFIKTKIIIFRYSTIIRGLISIIAKVLTYSEFNNSKITQITGAYYAIPIGDFLYTNSRTNTKSIIGALGLLLGIILFKDLIYEISFMQIELFKVNLKYILIILGLIFSGMIAKGKIEFKSGIWSLLLFGALCFLIQNMMNYQVMNINVHLLSYFISIASILIFLFRKSRLKKIINFIIIGLNILILLAYEAKLIAILGSICYASADILIQKYASHTKSELLIYSVSIICVLLPIIAIKNNYNIFELLMINTSMFPQQNINWLFVWITSLCSITTQFALVTCFSKHNLNTYLPFRYIDLIASSIIDRRYVLGIIPAIFSVLFAYFI